MILFPVKNCNCYEFSKSFETNIEGDKSPWEARQKRSVHMCLNDRDEKRNQLLIDSICLIFLQKKILTTNCKIVSHNNIRLLCLLRWYFQTYIFFWNEQRMTKIKSNRWEDYFHDHVFPFLGGMKNIGSFWTKHSYLFVIVFTCFVSSTYLLRHLTCVGEIFLLRVATF